jgi:raffinose/stachyose/melibiose transport system substrate-binding protein
MRIPALRVGIAIVLSTAILFACTPRTTDRDLGQVTVTPRQALVIYVSGDVSLADAGRPSKVAVGDLLTEGQSIRTGAASVCELQFGAKAAVRIEEKTEVLLASVNFREGAMSIGIDALAGTVLCKVRKLSGSERFQIKTPTAICGVRGTEFGVTVTAQADTLLMVNQGAVGLLPSALDRQQLNILTADLKISEAEHDSIFAGLLHAERVVGANQSAVLTQATEQRAIETRSLVADEVRKLSLETPARTPSATEKAKLNAVVARAAAEILQQLPAPRPQTDAERETMKRLDDLKQHMLKSVQVEADATQPVTLTIWMRVPDNTDPRQEAYTRALVENFEKKNPDIKIDWVTMASAGYSGRLTEALLAKRGPDVFQTPGGRVPPSLAAAGLLLDLTDGLSSVPALDTAKKAMSVGNRLYGVAPYFAIAGLYFNEEKFSELGMKIPGTLEELEQAADSLKARGIQPFVSGAKSNWPVGELFLYLVSRYDRRAYEGLIERKIGFDSDAFVRAGQKIQEWSKKGYFGSGLRNESYEDAISLMKAGKAGMMACGSWLCADFSDKNQTSQQISFFPFPEITGGRGDRRDTMGGNSIGFVAAQSSTMKKNAIIKFMSFVMSPEACQNSQGNLCSVPGVLPENALLKAAGEVLAGTDILFPWIDEDLGLEINTDVARLLLDDADPQTTLANAEKRLTKTLGPLKP